MKTLPLDVGELASETQTCVKHWLENLEATPDSHIAANVKKHLGSLVHVVRKDLRRESRSNSASAIPAAKTTSEY